MRERSFVIKSIELLFLHALLECEQNPTESKDRPKKQRANSS